MEPLGPFEDDPNVTDKKFPGNITQSYRTHSPLLVVGELERWEGHAPEVLAHMLDDLTRLREQGLDVIEDWSLIRICDTARPPGAEPGVHVSVLAPSRWSARH